MKIQPILVGLVALNSAVIGLQYVRGSSAAPAPVVPILRARAFELVDDAGRVRAELKVMPAQTDVRLPDGTSGYPETVLLRLVNSKNGPNVKLEATEDGSGLVLGGEKGYVQIISRTHGPSMNVVTKDGRRKTIEP